MKARVKATGEIVAVRPYGSHSSSVIWKDIYRNITYADCELDFEVTNKDEIYNKGWADGWDEAVKSEIPKIHPRFKGSDSDYWEKLKHQYAGMAMQGMVKTYEQMMRDDIECKMDCCEHVDAEVANGVLRSHAEACAEFCVEFATALVEKLKESNV